jgi:hypothetical protein
LLEEARKVANPCQPCKAKPAELASERAAVINGASIRAEGGICRRYFEHEGSFIIEMQSGSPRIICGMQLIHELCLKCVGFVRHISGSSPCFTKKRPKGRNLIKLNKNGHEMRFSWP